MNPYLAGKYWWLGVATIAVFTLLLFHVLVDRKPVKKVIQEPAIAAPVPKPVAKTSVPTHPVLELFNPSTENITRDQAISRIRGELEQLLVIGIMLNRCDIITGAEYNSILHAGKSYAERTRLFSDGDALMRELLVLAEKTYRLVYAGTSCSEQSLAALKEQTMAWQAQYNTTP